MDILVRLSVPNYIYEFYKATATHVARKSSEDIMSDALCAYAVFLSEDISFEKEQEYPPEMRKEPPKATK